jgi:hypothetical protein
MPASERVVIRVEPVPGAKAVRLHWDAVPGASHYNLYASPDLDQWTLRHADITGTTWEDDQPGNTTAFYSLKAFR